MQINQGKKETMYRKTIATAVAGLLILGLGACGNASDAKTADAGSASQSQTTKKPAEKKPVEQPADLTGTWKQTNSGSTDSWMEAEITADTITVQWVSGGQWSSFTREGQTLADGTWSGLEPEGGSWTLLYISGTIDGVLIESNRVEPTS